MLKVTVYSDLSMEAEPDVFDGIDYVSLVSEETYGPPALVAPSGGKASGAHARPGDTVLYINTKFIPLWKIKRLSD